MHRRRYVDFSNGFSSCLPSLRRHPAPPPPSSPPFPPPLLEVFSHLFNFIAPEQLFYRPCLLNGQSKRANESIFNYVNSRWNKQIGWSYAHFSVRGFRLVGSRSKCLFPILTDIKLHIDSLRFYECKATSYETFEAMNFKLRKKSYRERKFVTWTGGIICFA